MKNLQDDLNYYEIQKQQIIGSRDSYQSVRCVQEYGGWQSASYTFSGQGILDEHGTSWWYSIKWKKGRFGYHMKSDSQTKASVRQAIATKLGRPLDEISSELNISPRGQDPTKYFGNKDVMFNTYTIGYQHRSLHTREERYFDQNKYEQALGECEQNILRINGLIQLEQARLQEEARLREEAARLQEEARLREEAARLQEEARLREEAARLQEEARLREEAARLQEEARLREEAARLEEEQRPKRQLIAELKVKLDKKSQLVKENNQELINKAKEQENFQQQVKVVHQREIKNIAAAANPMKSLIDELKAKHNNKFQGSEASLSVGNKQKFAGDLSATNDINHKVQELGLHDHHDANN